MRLLPEQGERNEWHGEVVWQWRFGSQVHCSLMVRLRANLLNYVSSASPFVIWGLWKSLPCRMVRIKWDNAFEIIWKLLGFWENHTWSFNHNLLLLFGYNCLPVFPPSHIMHVVVIIACIQFYGLLFQLRTLLCCYIFSFYCEVYHTDRRVYEMHMCILKNNYKIKSCKYPD